MDPIWGLKKRRACADARGVNPISGSSSGVDPGDAAAVEMQVREKHRQMQQAMNTARLIDSASAKPMPVDATFSTHV
jgi:hypothetical protein